MTGAVRSSGLKRISTSAAAQSSARSAVDGVCEALRLQRLQLTQDRLRREELLAVDEDPPPP